MGPQRSFPPRRKENTGLPESGSTGALRSMLLVVALAVIAFGLFVKSGQPPEMDGGQTEDVRLAEQQAPAPQEETTLPDPDGDDDTGLERRLLAEAGRGNAEAQYQLGLFYAANGDLQGDRSVAKCAFWMRKAAERGYAEAQDLLSFMYTGEEVPPQNRKGALRRYDEIVRKGDPVALIGLRLMHLDGDAGQPDRERTAVYLLEAARTAAGVKGASRDDLPAAFLCLSRYPLTLAGGKPSVEAVALERELERRLTPEERAEGRRKAEKMLKERDRRAS